jgi:hypothetical protein
VSAARAGGWHHALPFTLKILGAVDNPFDATTDTKLGRTVDPGLKGGLDGQ